MKSVLILCTGNSARSQMAEGLLRHLAGGLIEVSSAGTIPSTVRREAIEALQEIGIDISHHRSKGIHEFQDTSFDVVLTVCDNAKETCPFFPASVKVMHRSFEDPPHEGDVPYEESLAVFRRVRDEIAQYLQAEFLPGFQKESKGP